MPRFSTKRDVIFKRFAMSLLCTGVLGAFSMLHADAPSAQSSSQDQEVGPDLFNKDKRVYFVNAEFLLWQVNESGIDYAIKNNQPPWSTTVDNSATGNYKTAHYDWTPGFRINVGYFNAPHYWDVVFQYTRVSSHGTRTAHAPDAADGFLLGTWLPPTAGAIAPPVPLETARCHMSLNYNVLDWLFSRRFVPNPHLRVNIFGGITSALMFQKMRIFYRDIENQHANIRNRWRFEGVGFRVGVTTDWYLGCNIYWSAIASAGAVSGWYKNSSFEKVSAVIPNANTNIPVFDVHLHDRRITYTTQFNTGLSWQKTFKNYRTIIFAGYEMNIWTNLNEIRQNILSAPTGEKQVLINSSHLSLQGLTVRFNLDF